VASSAPGRPRSPFPSARNWAFWQTSPRVRGPLLTSPEKSPSFRCEPLASAADHAQGNTGNPRRFLIAGTDAAVYAQGRRCFPSAGVPPCDPARTGEDGKQLAGLLRGLQEPKRPPPQAAVWFEYGNRVLNEGRRAPQEVNVRRSDNPVRRPSCSSARAVNFVHQSK
jgi:hypothetical protein